MLEEAMRTTLTISDDILEDLMRFSKAKTRTEAVRLALAEWVRRKRIEKLKSLRGKLPIEGNLEKLRELETEETETFDG